jgi:hypothetical protein
MAASNDDYDDFMEKTQARFKERNAVLKSSTPVHKEKLLQSKPENSPKKLVDEPKPVAKIPVKEWKTPTKQV